MRTTGGAEVVLLLSCDIRGNLAAQLLGHRAQGRLPSPRPSCSCHGMTWHCLSSQTPDLLVFSPLGHRQCLSPNGASTHNYRCSEPHLEGVRTVPALASVSRRCLPAPSSVLSPVLREDVMQRSQDVSSSAQSPSAASPPAHTEPTAASGARELAGSCPAPHLPLGHLSAHTVCCCPLFKFTLFFPFFFHLQSFGIYSQEVAMFRKQSSIFGLILQSQDLLFSVALSKINNVPAASLLTG